MWRGRKTGGWEGHRLSLVSGVLENNGTASYHPSCTHTHTHTLLDSALWICSWPFRPHPFYTCQHTSLRRMRPPPGQGRSSFGHVFSPYVSWPVAAVLWDRRQLKGLSRMPFLFIEVPSTKGSAHHWFSLTSNVFLLLSSLAIPSPTWGSFIKSCLFQIIYIQ